MGDMETLKVDPSELAAYGRELVSAAGDIPDAPAPFVTSGQDAISQAITRMQATIEGPIVAGLPQVKDEATATGAKVVDAAATYLRVDEEIAETIKALLAGESGPGSTGGSPGAVSAAPAGTAQTTQSAVSTASSAASTSAASGGDMSQLMSMPMQMAGQAAQIPAQAAGMLSAIPQAAMQAVQQVTQMAGGTDSSDTAETEPSEPAESETEMRPGEFKAGASGPERVGERAPIESADGLPAEGRPGTGDERTYL